MEKNILFSAFDAGGGNAVLPVVKNILKDKRFKPFCLVGGPSKEIFKKEKINFVDADSIDKNNLFHLVNNLKPSLFISGTSGGPTFDKEILSIIKKLKTKSVYILDYWSHYWQRFSDKEKDFKYLPDIICVMDDRAKKEMIEEGFNSGTIEITGNPYFDYFRENIKNGNEEKSTILFVSQPMTENKVELGYDEFDVLDDLLEVVNDLQADYKIIIRTHPREKETKYSKYLNKNIKIESNSPIEQLVSRAGLVFGMNSMVLFQSSIAGKKVISYQPNLKTKDSLISNAFGLSILVTEKYKLKNLINQYHNGEFPALKKETKNIIVPNATKNIVDLITV